MINPGFSYHALGHEIRGEACLAHLNKDDDEMNDFLNTKLIVFK